MKRWILCLVFLLFPMAARAELVSQLVDYKDGEVNLRGYLVYDDAVEGKRPGIVVVHDWMGSGEYSNWRAEELAKLGYIAFAVDMYGKDNLPQNTDEAAALAGKFKSDRQMMRDRAGAGYEVLKLHPLSDPEKMAAIGYCFGGTVVLEMARAGLDLDGVASFHGGLDSPDPGAGQNIKGSVLVLHGADDPFVPEADIAAFKKEMEDAGADLRFVAYPGAVHSFTQTKADEDTMDGTAYNAEADQDSWEKMKELFNEIFSG
jgi:dienelactone hydrolase